ITGAILDHDEVLLGLREHIEQKCRITLRIEAPRMRFVEKLPGQLTMSILKANVADPAYTDRTTYRPARPPAGFGMALTTYDG
ncbi:hypothetical protein C2W62_54135, partial [Candidatus Entotheonella serta]